MTNTSPDPRMFVQNTMVDFFSALKQLAAGKRITRLEWENNMIFGVLTEGRVVIHKEDGFHDWIISDGDLMGKDWIVLEEKPVSKLAID